MKVLAIISIFSVVGGITRGFSGGEFSQPSHDSCQYLCTKYVPHSLGGLCAVPSDICHCIISAKNSPTQYPTIIPMIELWNGLPPWLTTATVRNYHGGSSTTPTVVPHNNTHRKSTTTTTRGPPIPERRSTTTTRGPPIPKRRSTTTTRRPPLPERRSTTTTRRPSLPKRPYRGRGRSTTTTTWIPYLVHF